MCVVTARVEIIIGYSKSLKDKRRVVKSVIERISRRFNVSIAEIEDQDILQLGVIGIACISSSYDFSKKQINSVIRFIENDGRFEIGRIETEAL